jgi:hypothetical protein
MFLSQWKRFVCRDGWGCAAFGRGAAGSGDPKPRPDAAAATDAAKAAVPPAFWREPGRGGGGRALPRGGGGGGGGGGVGMHVAVLAGHAWRREGRSGGGGGGGVRPAEVTPVDAHSETLSKGACETLSETAMSGAPTSTAEAADAAV